MSASCATSVEQEQNPAYSTKGPTPFTGFKRLTVRKLIAFFFPSTFKLMANSKAAQKYIRKTETRTLQNRQVKSRLKTLSKKVSTAAEAGDKDALVEATRQYTSALDKAGKTGLVHANKIARHKARCAELTSA